MKLERSRLDEPARRLLAALLEAPGEGRPVAFDADGTLWRGDVGEELLRYLAAEGLLPNFRASSGVYSEYERRLAVDPEAAYAFCVEVMEGLEEAALQSLCRDFFARRFAGRVFPFVRPLLRAVASAGYECWIVSGSPRWIVAAGAEALGLSTERVLAVECELSGGRLARPVRRPLPCGEGKVAQLRSRGLRPALAVGNSELDLPMLRFAERALVVAPHGDEGELVRAARALGWPVQRG